MQCYLTYLSEQNHNYKFNYRKLGFMSAIIQVLSKFSAENLVIRYHNILFCTIPNMSIYHSHILFAQTDNCDAQYRTHI